MRTVHWNSKLIDIEIRIQNVIEDQKKLCWYDRPATRIPSIARGADRIGIHSGKNEQNQTKV